MATPIQERLVVGKKIKSVIFGDATGHSTEKYIEGAPVRCVEGITFEDGSRIYFAALEGQYEPYVYAGYVSRKENHRG